MTSPGGGTMLRDPQRIRALVAGHPDGGTSELTSKSTHKSPGWRRRRKLRLEELYAMYLAKKPYNQLTKLDKEISREDLARKVLKHYFSSSWGRGYFQLLRELEDFYDKFPKAGRDKVTFVRFIRSLGVVELKRVFTADPDTLFSAVLWLERNKHKAERGGSFTKFYQRVLRAVSELRSDKWSKKFVKAVFRLVEEFKPSKGREESKPTIFVGGKEGNFYDYFALFLMRGCRTSAGAAFTAAVLTTRHVIAEYFFDPKLSYHYRLIKIKEHFRPLFKEYPEAEAFLDDYFIRSVVNSMTWQDLVRFVGADVEKLEQYYRKNKHKLSSNTKFKILKAIAEYQTVGRDKLKEWWDEHIQSLASLTALCS